MQALRCEAQEDNEKPGNHWVPEKTGGGFTKLAELTPVELAGCVPIVIEPVLPGGLAARPQACGFSQKITVINGHLRLS